MALRATVLREGIAPVRDRLTMTIFLAALLHGMIILGLTFSNGFTDGEAAPGLAVLLVSDEVPAADRNDSATYLAQRTQLGSGNTQKSVRPRNRAGAKPVVAHEGLPDGTSLKETGATTGAQDERVLATTAPRAHIQYFSDPSLPPISIRGAAASSASARSTTRPPRVTRPAARVPYLKWRSVPTASW
jgi:periplasmic protein TonB